MKKVAKLDFLNHDFFFHRKIAKNRHFLFIYFAIFSLCMYSFRSRFLLALFDEKIAKKTSFLIYFAIFHVENEILRIFLNIFYFQVYVSCNFCGKAISRYTNGLPESALGTPDLEKRKINATLNLNALQRHTTRFQSCPACKKPTPRCSICLVNMGSHSGYLTGMPSMLPDPSKKRLGIKVTPFSNFFVWCQVCRHGGHAEHIEGNL